MAQSSEQQLIGVSNGNITDKGIQLNWSIGETFIAFQTTDFGLLTEGFIQPAINQREQFPPNMIKGPFELTEGLSLKISPNPVRDLITLNLENPLKELTYICIIDFTGKLVLTDYFHAGHQQMDLDMAPFPNGLYLIQLISPGKTILANARVLKVSE
jgi:hypothetical protein